ncbi:hypothetical protein [Aurantiacibacter luteus]|uniref:hypothetical protein n=1 Tax=Aurantiacibacter luteus TaxID=1581420 RepID=UPI0012E01FEE|nr:hypothetical protein [Aurantiacibacter luteus]
MIGAMGFGTYAEWASALGSVLAVIVALYLSGSAKRQARLAHRPEIFCETRIKEDDPNFIWIRFRIENHSIKEWGLGALELLKPKTPCLIDERAVLRENTLGDEVFDHSLRADHMVSVVELDTILKPFGSKSGERRTDLMSRIFYIPVFETQNGFTISISMASLEPIPDRFVIKVSRPRLAH